MELFLKHQIGTHSYSTINNSVVSSKQDKKLGESSWPRLRAEWCVGPIFCNRGWGNGHLGPNACRDCSWIAQSAVFLQSRLSYQKKSLYLHLSGRCASVAYPRRYILDESVFVLSLLEIWKISNVSGIGNYIHHWFGVLCVPHRLHTSVGYCLFDTGFPEPPADKRNAPHFFVIIPVWSTWIKPEIYG